MATRQTSSKSGQRGAPSAAARGRAAAAGKPARGAANAPAKPAKPAKGTAAAGGQPSRGGGPPAAKRGPSGLGAAWRATVTWAGGGVPFTTLIVSLLGLADAAYLTYQHFSQATTFAGCSDKGTINCEAVTTSAWSHVGFFPVSVLGLAFFAFMVAVNSPWGWRAPWSAVHWARLGSVVVGIVFVLYLIWAELFRINAICLYCTGVHVLTFILFGLVIGRAAFSGVRAAPGRS
jgi:uncharacterized membrane protein